MNTIITASVAGLSSGSGSDAQTLRQGANQTPIPKVWAQHISTVLASQLKPVTLVRVVGQGPNNNTLSVSHYGPCPEVPDGQALVGIVPLIAGTQTKDDFGLPIAGAPAENQKLLQYQTAPGDPYALGISSKSPDGVTSPAIPNSGDVTPGTAASNPAAYLTGPVTKQHPWITDIVAGCGISQTAYGKYDYTDPTGTLHTALGKGDSKVKKPLLEIKRATNTTPLYSGQVTLAGSSPTEYLHSGLRCADDAGENHGLVVNTKWGTNIDKDDAVDVWLAASTTLPTDGMGDQTARALPCYDGDVYNTSALGEDGGDSGHALYVKLDGKSTSQTADGKVRSQAIKVTHALPPIDADIPATAEDGALVDATVDDSLWMRSSGALIRVSLPTGGVTGDKLLKLSDTNYDVGWGGAGCLCLDMPGLISLIGSVSGAGGGTPSGGIHYSAESTYLSNGPGLAFDGDSSTSWGSDTKGPGPWLEVDFGVPVPIHRTNVIQPNGTAPWDPPGTGAHQMDSYEIQASSNGSTWVTIASHSGGIPLGGDVLDFASATYRYWRMLCTGEPAHEGTAIQEFQLS